MFDRGHDDPADASAPGAVGCCPTRWMPNRRVRGRHATKRPLGASGTRMAAEREPAVSGVPASQRCPLLEGNAGAATSHKSRVLAQGSIRFVIAMTSKRRLWLSLKDS